MAAPDSMRVAKRPPRMIKAPKITAIDMLRRTDKGDRERSRDIAIVKIARVLPPKNLAEWSARVVTCRNKDNGHNHRVNIWSPDRIITSHSLIVANCDCPRMVYWYEVVNAEKLGASFIFRSNGQPSNERNPLQRPGLCKHCYLALRTLVKRGDLKITSS